MNIEKAIDLLSNGESDERMSGFIKYYATSCGLNIMNIL